MFPYSIRVFFWYSRYIIGKYFVGQVGAFAVIAIFALLNIALIRAITIRLGANWRLILELLCLLRCNFTYLSLYQHHISTLLLLLAIHVVLRWSNLWSVALVWFLTALALVVDNPNVFFMLPVPIYALGRIIQVKQEERKIKINFKLAGSITFLAIIFPAFFFMWFNYKSYGSYFQLPGTIKSIQEVDESTDPIVSKSLRVLRTA